MAGGIEHRAIGTHAAGGTARQVGTAQELRVCSVVTPAPDIAGADPLAVLAVADLDRVGLADVQAEERIPAIAGQVAGAGSEGRLLRVAIAVTGNAVGTAQDGALEVAAQDDADDAGDGVGAIDRRGAVLESSTRLTASSGMVLRSVKTFWPSSARPWWPCGGRSTAPASSRRPGCAARCRRRHRRSCCRRSWNGACAVGGQGLQVRRPWSCRCGRFPGGSPPAPATVSRCWCAGCWSR